jgi:hypothetical protein
MTFILDLYVKRWQQWGKAGIGVTVASQLFANRA